MISKLRIIPLGGLGEIGKNMTAFEYGNDIIVVDCGMGFPDEDMYGVDVVLPDITYLRNNAARVRGLILTHGHEDHIGAVPYVLKELDIPIYTTPLTAALVELKLEEHDLLYNTQIFTKKAGSVFRLGNFTIEFIHVNHSIPDSVALAITTPLGTVIHTGDFKIDVTPISGGMMDLVRLGELGNQGVLALLSDSTNVERPGHSESERKVGVGFDQLFLGCDKRIIITTFASNVHRLQQIIDVAAKYGRKVAVTGRSMENVLRVSMVLGYMNIPEGVLTDLDHINKLPRNKVVILSTGSSVVLPWADKVGAILQTYLLGEGFGAALPALVLGEVSPSGKLAETYPKALRDVPCLADFKVDHNCNLKFRESIFVGYRYYDTAGKEVAYPFGYGLSYTKFDYSDLKVAKTDDGNVAVSFNIKNVGGMKADEIAQVYVGACFASKVYRAKKELKEFARVSLDPGETKTVKVKIKVK